MIPSRRLILKTIETCPDEFQAALQIMSVERGFADAVTFIESLFASELSLAECALIQKENANRPLAERMRTFAREYLMNDGVPQ